MASATGTITRPAEAADRARAALDALIDDLNGPARRPGERLRVWSVAMTVFGDAVVPRGGVVRLGALAQITDRLGIENNALRTAMSRLAIDGWLERERLGRRSYYRLTASGLDATLAASALIYSAHGPAWRGEWQAAMPTGAVALSADDRERLGEAGFHANCETLFVRPWNDEMPPLAARIPVALFRLRAQSPDGDLRLANPAAGELDRQYDEARRLFAPLAHALEGGAALGPLDAMVARTLLIHVWRRIVLKDVRLPDELRGPDWPGHEARRLVADLYANLLPASEQWLDDCDGAPAGRLPPPAEPHRRFTRDDRS